MPVPWNGRELPEKTNMFCFQVIFGKRILIYKIRVDISTLFSSDVVCGSGPGGSRPHNRRCVRHRGRTQPRLSRTAAVESNSRYASNIYWLTPVSSCCSRQTQGVVGTALNRWHELRVRCTASASRSSAEAASSVLSTSPENWIEEATLPHDTDIYDKVLPFCRLITRSLLKCNWIIVPPNLWSLWHQNKQIDILQTFQQPHFIVMLKIFARLGRFMCSPVNSSWSQYKPQLLWVCLVWNKEMNQGWSLPPCFWW